MMNKRNTVIFSTILAIVVLAGVMLVSAQDDVPFGGQIRNGMMQGNEDMAAAAAEYQRTDQITTVLCGTGSPISRTGAQTCTAVFVNGQLLLFDVGNNSLESMLASNIPVEEIDGIFLTHYHNDHFADLGEVMELSWMNGREHLLKIHGPTGLTSIVDAFNNAYALDRHYRTAHHGVDIMPPQWAGTETIEFPTPQSEQWIVYEEDGVVVRSFAVEHHPIHPAVGYRIEYAGKSIVISGDTILTSDLPGFSQDADLLVAEVMNMDVIALMEETSREIGNERQAILFFDIRDYHMDVSDVGELAQAANVERLALTHYMPVPANDLIMNQWFVNPLSDIYDGEIIAGGDGTTIIIPLDEE